MFEPPKGRKGPGEGGDLPPFSRMSPPILQGPPGPRAGATAGRLSAHALGIGGLRRGGWSV